MRECLLCILAILAWELRAQSGCPGCEVSLPTLPEDTLYLAEAPGGRVSQYYEADLGFRLPKTTTPVAAIGYNVPPGFGLSRISILTVANVPPGLQWEASQRVFDPRELTDGCVRFCGTPLVAGVYEVEVVLEASVVIISQKTSLKIPIEILPAQTVTAGFTLDNGSGCGEVAAVFSNNAPSAGAPGFSYRWDFGDGRSSTAEEPGTVIYDRPGKYAVAYEAIVDTTGYFLTQVTVNNVGCTDLIGDPDLKINVFDPAGNYIYTSPIVENAKLPVQYELSIPIGEGIYRLQVVDDDNGAGGKDDDCGDVNFSRSQHGTFENGPLRLTAQVIHPVDTIRSVDTVRVYAQPEPPLLDPDETTALCPGDSLSLQVLNFSQGLQWYRDSLPLVVADTSQLTISDSAHYWVTYTSPDGCRSTSAALRTTLLPTLNPIVLKQTDNLLELTDDRLLPDDYTFTWYYGDEVVADTEELRLCIGQAGSYSLVITDRETGCSVRAAIEATYNPAINCLLSANEWLLAAAWKVFPNPAREDITLEGQVARPMDIGVSLYDMLGRRLHSWRLDASTLNTRLQISLAQLPAGVYRLQISGAGEQVVLPIVKN